MTWAELSRKWTSISRSRRASRICIGGHEEEEEVVEEKVVVVVVDWFKAIFARFNTCVLFHVNLKCVLYHVNMKWHML